MAINKKIKGITIQFEGDTTSLGKALSGIETKVVNTESELRKVNRALKDIDPNNVVLLAQKQDILAEAIEASKKKLEGLEDAQEDVEKQFKDGGIGADTYREFQRTVEATKKKLESLETESENLKNDMHNMASNGADFAADKIEDVGETAKNEGKKIDNLGDDFNNAEKDARNLGGGIDAIQVALGNIAADKIQDLGTALKDYAVDSQTATNNFAAQTGVTAEEMEKYNGVIDELYKSNFGESKNDVANAMATIKQTVGEIDPDRLKEMTENAMTLSDVFGFDVSEQMRAVNMLMNQFGVDSNEAFNLIVDGAQNGLNKNGDLLDTINEYSVHYKQLGYDADDFFNSLSNGTASGTFSVDKLGDAMKEFGIRSKDTATTTTEGFELIGLDADKMREKFSKGGESAKAATEETLKALFSLDDQVVMNQAGVDLFGTMWEDLGKDGVKALTNTNGEIGKTKDALKKVKEVKYNDITTEITGLGREFQEEVLEPVIKDFMPDIKKGIGWLKDNLPKLKPMIKGIGTVAVTAFVVNKISNFTSSVGSLIGGIKGLSSATGILSNGIKLLSGPAGLILGGAGLVAALGAATYAIATNKENTFDLTEEQKRLHDELDTTKTKLQEMYEANVVETSEKDSEFGYYHDLQTELQTIVDKNGKIKEGYEDRAKYIVEELGKVTENEIKINDGVIENYEELNGKISDYLNLKRAESTLSIYEDDFSDAIQNKSKYYKDMKTVEGDYLDSVERLGLLKEEYENMKASYIAQGDSLESAENKSAGEKRAYEDYKRDVVDPLRNDYIAAQNLYLDSLNTITNYERLNTAILSGNVEDTNVALQMLENGYVNAEHSTEKSLKNNVTNMEQHYKDLQEAIKNGEPGVTEEMVVAAKTAFLKSKFEANEQISNGSESLTEQVKKSMSDSSGVLSDEAKKLGGQVGQGFIEGFAAEFYVIDNRSRFFHDADAEGIIGPMQATEEGIREYWDIRSPSKRAARLGSYVMQGFANGFSDEKSSLFNEIESVGTDTVSALKNQLDNLPSVNLNARYSAAVSSGNITPTLGGSKMFNISIGEFVNNTDSDIDSLVRKISVKLNDEISRTSRGMGW